MHIVLSNPQAMRYWSTLPHTDIEQTGRWLDAMIESPAEESFDFVIEHDGRVIGKAGMWRVPEIGFILHPDHWGQGLATEAISAVISAAFARFPIAEITADVDPRNTACLALLKKLEFVETGHARNTYLIGGVWCDSIYLAHGRDGVQPPS